MSGFRIFTSASVSVVAMVLSIGVSVLGCGGNASTDTDVAEVTDDVVCDDGLDTGTAEDVFVNRDIEDGSQSDVAVEGDANDVADEDASCILDCMGLECGLDPVCGIQDCGISDDGYSCQDGECIPNGMVLIPAGAFWMGCNEAVDDKCLSNERPYHEVTLSAYYIDQTEVTQSEFKKCVDAVECGTPDCNWDPTGAPDKPVVCVDRNDATAYCAWAGKRLPTEAEWEKAARGTDGRKYPWGNEPASCDYAVMYDVVGGCGTGGTWDVCSKSPEGDSPYGLCDMAGNVFEWVSDWYDSEYYTVSPSSNPQGPSSGSYGISRGGAFAYYYGDHLRASNRVVGSPLDSYIILGFRCARDAL